MKNLLTEKNFNIVMATAVLLILAIPVGIAAVYLGFVKGESPCLLCGHERFGMVLVGILGLFMLRYGMKIKYIAPVFIIAFFWIYEAMRHIGNHGTRDLGQGFGEAIFGLHTYSWAFVVYWVVILAMGLMLFFIRGDNEIGKDFLSSEIKIKNGTPYTKGVLIVSIVIVALNVYQFFMSNGIPPFGGSGEPARFTANLSKSSQYWDNHHWYENFTPAKASFLGQNVGPTPHIPFENENNGVKFKTNFADNPLNTANAKLEILDTKELGFAALSSFKKGVAGGIAYDSANDEFAIISTGAAVYFTDENFKDYKDFATMDQVNGSDIPISVDATFYAPGKLVGIAYNKAIWGVERVSSDKIDEVKQWKFIREVSGDLMPMFKGKRIPIGTTRAKKAYILSLAKDPNSNYAYMVSIPAAKVKNAILLKYDTTDNTISEESILKFSPNVSVKEGAKASEFYITGADIAEGKMLAISKNFNALVVIDLASKTIENAYELPSVGDAHDIAIKGERLYILSRDGGKDKIFIVNNPLK